MAKKKEQQESAPPEQKRRGGFEVRKIYLKNVSLETPGSPRVFQEEWKPSIHLDMASSMNALSDALHEVSLSVTATAKDGDETVYLAEVQQAGIFFIDNIPQELVNRVLATACPTMLLPFVRSQLSSLVTGAGFPQLLLAPVNFEALYLEHQRRAAAGQAGAADPSGDVAPPGDADWSGDANPGG